MPAAIEYIPPTDNRRNEFNSALISERTIRRTRYLKALRYYNGEHPEQLDYDAEIEPNDNTIINLVQITADRTASFLFPSVPTFQTNPNTVQETKEEKWIRKVFEENGGLAFLVRLALRGFLAGHAFVRVKSGKQVGRRKGLPQFILLDPLAVTIFWNADDVGEVLWYENRYVVGNDVYIQDYVWRPERGEAGEWEIFTYKTDGGEYDLIDNVNAVYSPHGAGNLPRTEIMDFVSSKSFKLVPTPDGKNSARHTSPIPPIIEFPHFPHPDDRYGHGEVTQTDLQDTINRVWSEINRIVRKHANPRDVVVGADLETVKVGKDITVVEPENAKVSRLEMRGDLKAAVDTVERLIDTYLAIARVVLLKGDAADLQRVTNASVRTLFVDMLAKNEVLRSSYGRGLVSMARLAMMMADDQPFQTKALDMELEIKWGEPLPVDKLEIANINAMAVAGGWRSKRTAATALGDNWAFEEQAMQAEQQLELDRLVKQAQVMAQVTPPTPDEQSNPQQEPDGGSERAA